MFGVGIALWIAAATAGVVGLVFGMAWCVGLPLFLSAPVLMVSFGLGLSSKGLRALENATADRDDESRLPQRRDRGPTVF